MSLACAKESIVARKRAQVIELDAQVKKLEAENGDQDEIGGLRTIIWLINMEIRDIVAVPKAA